MISAGGMGVGKLISVVEEQWTSLRIVLGWRSVVGRVSVHLLFLVEW